ncbi:MAG: YkgJ family cysteine cluster protein [Succinivibrionaceae bacterium]|nr:YkgJ family cysteine cluster protein [Succinivibrionaceae bacterium]
MCKFDCERCGLCCQKVRGNRFFDLETTPEGDCIHYDHATRLCRIYDHRPIYCRVDDFYDLHVKPAMTREEYHQKIHAICRELQFEQGLNDLKRGKG